MVRQHIDQAIIQHRWRWECIEVGKHGPPPCSSLQLPRAERKSAVEILVVKALSYFSAQNDAAEAYIGVNYAKHAKQGIADY